MSSSTRIVIPTLVILAAVGAVALAFAAALTLGASPAAHADVVPVRLPADVLGVGDAAIPLEGVRYASAKVSVCDEAALPASMTSGPDRRANAPLPKPKPKPAPKPAAAPRTEAPAPSRAADTTGWQSARASWYGPGFYGRTTASGAVLTENMMNVAHRTLPFGTQVQFEYNGRTATAVVNDRGPHIAGRVWDLGPGTAKALGFSGVGMVNYRILGR